METRSLNIDLGLKKVKIKGSEYLIAPITEPLKQSLYKGEKALYLKIKVLDTQSQFSDCSVCLDVKKDVKENFTEEQKKQIWIGSGKIFGKEEKIEEINEEDIEEENLPF